MSNFLSFVSPSFHICSACFNSIPSWFTPDLPLRSGPKRDAHLGLWTEPKGFAASWHLGWDGKMSPSLRDEMSTAKPGWAFSLPNGLLIHYSWKTNLTCTFSGRKKHCCWTNACSAFCLMMHTPHKTKLRKLFDTILKVCTRHVC